MTVHDTEAPAVRADRNKAVDLVLAPGGRLSWWQEPLMLGARLYAGLTIAGAGLDKIPTPDWMVDQVAQLGFPNPEFFALCACHAEYFGGALLAFGILTRPAALLLAWTMGVAAFGWHENTPLLDMSIAQGFVWLFVVFAALGGGRLSMDQLVRTTVMKRWGAWRGLIVALVLALPFAGYGVVREMGAEAEPETSDEVTPTGDGA